MSTRDSLRLRDWLAGAALGLLFGTVVLGAGGRLAMSGIALVQGQAPRYSIGGTATVVFLGAVSGLAGAVVLLLLRLLLRRRPIVRGGLFWIFLTLVTLRGLRPVDAQRLALFFPLVIVYGATLQLAWCRVYRRRRGPAASLGGVAAT
jgi:hypothetical protein